MSNAQIVSPRLDAGRPAHHTGFMTKRKKLSGFVTEEQRHTERLSLRVKPGTTKKLDAIAFRLGVNRSEAVTMMIEKEYSR